MQRLSKTAMQMLIACVVFLGSTIPAEEVCTEAGCHAINSSVGIEAEDLRNLLQSLSKIDPALASEIDAKIVCEKCPIQDILAPYCLINVSINPESRVKVDSGEAILELTQGDWQTYLVRVVNLAGVTAKLLAHSDQLFIHDGTKLPSHRDRDQWLELKMVSPEPLPSKLTGKPLQYCLVRLKTDSLGKRTVVIAMDVGQGTADIGFRNDVVMTFRCVQSSKVSTKKTEAKYISLSAEPSELPNARPPESDQDLRKWLENMVWYHQFSLEEIQMATGLTRHEVNEALERFQVTLKTKPATQQDRLLVMPYPGGRHPRIGFLDGAVNPQRETKASVFTPWDDSSFVVLDVPEAIWSNLGLTYLAHTHVPTLWDLQNVSLEKLEWKVSGDGLLCCERKLPNNIIFGTELIPHKNSVRMHMWLENGTAETLSDLRVQNCVLLKNTKGFEQQTNDNKVFWGPYAACRNEAGDRWVITAWTPLHQAWGNADCPCLHSDPQFPDCLPGEIQHLVGWLSFYEGTNIHDELRRIDQTGWRNPPNQKNWGPLKSKVQR